MTIPLTRAQSVQRATPVPPLPARAPASPAAQGPVRRYDVRSLGPDGSALHSQHVAPATPLFEEAFCAFSHGALVETVGGAVAIEDLQPGDLVSTVGGRAAPVLWIGSTLILPGRGAAPGRNLSLTRIMADALGLQRPSACVIAGPAARLLHVPSHLRALAGSMRMVTPAADCVDGVNVIETAPPAPVVLYHLCLPRHAAIRVSGLEFETYHPGNRLRHLADNATRALFLSLFPHIGAAGDFGPLAYPRIGEDQIEPSPA